MRRTSENKIRAKIIVGCILLAGFFLLLNVDIAASEQKSSVTLLTIKGVIGHATKNYVERGIKYAENKKSGCVIIAIDTPGGLMDSMKDIASTMINADIPVVVYVYPNGSTATSAGFFILMASDFAAMAPNTSTGSAHPVAMGGQKMDKTMKEKSTNYAIKLMEQYVERRGRNKEIARNAVLKSISVTAEEALEEGVIEFIATDIDDLLSQIDGKVFAKGAQTSISVKIDNAQPDLLKALEDRDLISEASSSVVINIDSSDDELKSILEQNDLIREKGTTYELDVENADVEELPMSFKEAFFQLIGHPQIAYILFMIGVYALIFEVTHPGAIFPGVVGAVCLIIAFTAFQVIPINTVGLLLIIGAFVLFILELKIVSHGLLSVGGIILLFLGSLMLVDSTDPALKIDLGVILAFVGTTLFFMLIIVAAIIKTHTSKVSTGKRGMVGLTGKAIKDIDPEGTVSLRGEIWKAVSDGETIKKGDKVEVVDVEGMEVQVKKKE
mgnify:CR=1 FL=1